MSNNQILFERAQKTIPGGVKLAGARIPFGRRHASSSRAQGPYFWDADGKQYIDYIGSWG